MKYLCMTAAEKDAGRKVKYFVRGDLQVSYHQFAALKMSGGVKVNGETVHANHPLQPGDLVEVFLEDAPHGRAQPEALPVEILYEDDDLYILHKPAPLACQASPKQPSQTLENRLSWHYREVEDFVFRPLNRLDKGTSGLMAAAKHAHACQILQKQLHTPDFLREYLAVVEGALAGSGTIDLPIAKENAASIRRIVDSENGKPAITHYTSEGLFGDKTLVRLRLETGRTHQIRVHLSAIGHPIIGDFLYGTEDPRIPGRFALHSAYLALNAPDKHQRIECRAPLPAELSRLLTE